MKRELTITYDSKISNRVDISTPDGVGDPWDDLAILLEGVGVLTGACINKGKVEHNGQPLNEYLKDYIDKVCGSFKVLSVVK